MKLSFILQRYLLAASIISAGAIASQPTGFNPADHRTFVTDREDGRYVSSRAILHRMMQRNKPRLAFDASMDSTAFSAWQKDVGATMTRLMRHPVAKTTVSAQLLSVHQRDGYRIERWEIYPLDEAAVPFLVLIPDGVDAISPAPSILCIPGFGQTKEILCGETSVDISVSTPDPGKNAQAYRYVKEGWIAVAVDNPGCGEAADLEYIAGKRGPDYVTLSRALLELGWSYLGYASFVDRQILNWMKSCPEMRNDRLIVSGFSLGTEPLMVLGTLDPDIYAFVYNDFLCTTRERALTMTLPDNDGLRPWPNDISHLIPEFLCEFDFPDLVAALAPRPVICTEGGLDRDFTNVRCAFKIAGAQDSFEAHHYEKFNDPASREPIDTIPAGIDRATFFRLANVDPPRHYFKSEYIIPWLHRLLD